MPSRTMASWLSGIALCLLLGIAFASDEDHVIVLTSSNFDQVMKDHERVLVEFYAPWCGHCKSLEPEYKKAAKEMKDEGLKSVLAKVDATEEKELGSKYEVTGFPTIIYFVNGEKNKVFDGARDAAGVKSWMKKREVPAVQLMDEAAAVTHAEQLATFDKDGTFPAALPNSMFTLVARVVAKSARAKAFGAVMSLLVGDENNVVDGKQVTLPKSVDAKGPETSLVMWRPEFQDPDVRKLVYTGKWTEAAISAWVKRSIYGTVGQKFDKARYSDEAVERMGKKGVVVVARDDDDDDTSLKDKVLAELIPLAKEDHGFLLVTCSLDDLDEAAKTRLGWTESTPSSAALLHDGKTYQLPKNGDTAISEPGAIKGLIDGVLAKTIKPFYKSAEPPAGDVDEEGVTVVVGKTWERIVMDPKKDVLMEYYAPWCGHCKKLTPIYIDVAAAVKKNGWGDKVVIAKMDSTENHCPEEVSGYPKLILYPAVPAGKKLQAKMEVSGAREFDNIMDFLAENAKNDVGEVPATAAKAKSGSSMQARDKARKAQAAKGKGKGEL